VFLDTLIGYTHGLVTMENEHAPLFIVRATGTLNTEDCAVIAANSGRMLASPRFFVLFDTTGLKSIGASELRALAKNSKESEVASAERCALTALVVDSALIRGAFKAYLWMMPLKFPYSVHPTFDAALDAIERAAAAESVRLPRSVASLRRQAA